MQIRAGRNVLGVFCVCALGSWLAPSEARADVPRCAGSDVAAQGRARAEGLRRYRTATARDPVNRVEMAAALEAFEAQCRAGDVNALEMRAYALAALGRHVDAAESLDAFLDARPLQTLDADARARVGAQRGAILAEVATLTLDGEVADSSVMVNGRGYGSLPRPVIRLAPGEITVQVFAPSIGAVRRQFTMGPGETRREVFERGQSSVAANAQNGAATGANSQRNNTQSATNTATNAATNSDATTGSGGTSNSGVTTGPDPRVIVDTPRTRPTPVLPIVLGVGTVAFAGGFVATTLWRGGREEEARKPECANPTDMEIVNACRAVAGERDTAMALQITTGIVAGGLLIGAAVTLGLWATSAPRAPTRRDAATYCAPVVGSQTGVLCGARF